MIPGELSIQKLFILQLNTVCTLDGIGYLSEFSCDEMTNESQSLKKRGRSIEVLFVRGLLLT